MKLSWLFFSFIFTILVCGGSVGATTSEPVKPKHHIFYVHGFGGDETSFGSMPWLLATELQKQQPEYDFRSHYFHYGKTIDNNEIDVNNLGGLGIKETFSKFLGDFINKKVRDIKPEDRISIIAHSQGGLVSMIWVYNAALSDQPKYNYHLKDNLYSVVTIGTPFWGSKISTLYAQPQMSPIRWAAKGVMGLVFDEFAKAQLVDMSFASDSLREFFKNMMLIPDEKIKALKKKIRFLNVSGLAGYNPESPKWLDFFGGNYAYETDVAVSLPSSQIDFISFFSFEHDYEAGHTSSIDSARVKRLADTYITKGLHSKVTNGIPAIAAIPKECEDIDSSACTHDVYKVVVDYLQGKEVPSFHPDVNKDHLFGFTLELMIRLPDDIGVLEEVFIENRIKVLPVRYADEDMIYPGSEYGKTGKIRVNRLWEPMSKVVIYKPADDILPFNSLHVRMTGFFDLDLEEDKKLVKSLHSWGDTLMLEVTGLGFKKRFVEFPIRPTATMNLSINLERSSSILDGRSGQRD